MVYYIDEKVKETRGCKATEIENVKVFLWLLPTSPKTEINKYRNLVATFFYTLLFLLNHLFTHFI